MGRVMKTLSEAMREFQDAKKEFLITLYNELPIIQKIHRLMVRFDLCLSRLFGEQLPF